MISDMVHDISTMERNIRYLSGYGRCADTRVNQ